jgi:glycosyltransferase involved in cell wall biosynthesis
VELTKQKIAIVTERIFPFYNGGSEKAISDYAHMLSKNYSVTVFTSLDENSNKENSEDLIYERIAPKFKNNNSKGNHSVIGILFFSLFLVWNERKVSNFDLVLLDSIHYFYPRIFLDGIRRKKQRIATIFYEAWHDYRKSENFPSILSLSLPILIRRLLKYSDLVVSVSEPTTNSLVNNYQVKTTKLRTIPLSIDTDYIHGKFMITPVEHRENDIVFTGRLAEIKRIDDLITAIHMLVEEYPKYRNIRVIIIGDGPQKSVLKKKILEYHLTDNFTMPGYVDEDKKYVMLDSSKIFLLPSEREGFSIATLEAMALGCVPIVSKPHYDEVFGVSHFVKDHENGLYYDVGNIEQLASLIKELLENSELLQRLSENALECSKQFSRAIMQNRIEDAIGELLKCNNKVRLA